MHLPCWTKKSRSYWSNAILRIKKEIARRKQEPTKPVIAPSTATNTPLQLINKINAIESPNKESLIEAKAKATIGAKKADELAKASLSNRVIAKYIGEITISSKVIASPAKATALRPKYTGHIRRRAASSAFPSARRRKACNRN